MTVDDLKKYKDNLYSSLCRDLSEFEKNFILVSSGILAFTITFIKDLVKIDETKFLLLLVLAWFFIILSIGLMMYTFLRSAKASDDLFEKVDSFMVSNSYFDNEKVLEPEKATEVKNSINTLFYESKRKLRYLRLSAILFFLTGLIFLASFVYANLSKRNIKPPETTKGTVIIIKEDTLFNSPNIKLIYEKSKQTDTTPKSKTNPTAHTDAPAHS